MNNNNPDNPKHIGSRFMRIHTKHVSRLLLRPNLRNIYLLNNVVRSRINRYAIHTIMSLAGTIILCFAYKLLQKILKASHLQD